MELAVMVGCGLDEASKTKRDKHREQRKCQSGSWTAPRVCASVVCSVSQLPPSCTLLHLHLHHLR